MKEVLLAAIKAAPKRIWGLFFSREFAMYIVCGGTATIVDWGLTYSLTSLLGLWYVASVTLAYIGGVATNYSLNKAYTFKNKSRQIGRQLLAFQVVAGIGFLLNLGIVVGLVELLGLWYMLAKVIATGMVLAWSFVGHKHFTFRIT